MKRTVCWILTGMVCATLPLAAAGPGPRFHTRSIVACDPAQDACGIAVVSFPTGVPAIVPVGEPGVMVANQASPSYGTALQIIDGILSGGKDAPTALADALALDPGSPFRQYGVAALDPGSPSGVSVANFTGGSTIPETCEVVGDVYAVQANLQSSAAVCAAMGDAFAATEGSLGRRLLAAIRAGTPVGNDLRGEFSASLRVVSASWPLAPISPISTDANVDRAANWEEELEYSVNAYLAMLTPPDPRDQVELTRGLGKQVLKVLRDLGYYRGAVEGGWSDAAETALFDFTLFNLFFLKPTVVVGGTRFIDGPLADYLVLGAPRGVLTSAP